MLPIRRVLAPMDRSEPSMRMIPYAQTVVAGVFVEEGEPAKAVCSLASRLVSGILVIGRGPRDQMGGRLTAHADAIVRQSPCPVLSI